MTTDPISDASRLQRTDAGAVDAIARLRTAGRQGTAGGGETLPTGPSRDELAAAVDALREAFRSIRRELSFRVDEDLGRVVVSVRDSETGDLVRQIPGEHVIELARTLSEQGASRTEATVRSERVRGLMLDERA